MAAKALVTGAGGFIGSHVVRHLPREVMQSANQFRSKYCYIEQTADSLGRHETRAQALVCVALVRHSGEKRRRPFARAPAAAVPQASGPLGSVLCLGGALPQCQCKQPLWGRSVQRDEEAAVDRQSLFLRLGRQGRYSERPRWKGVCGGKLRTGLVNGADALPGYMLL